MSDNQPVEHILVVPTLLFHEIGYFQGFCADVDRYLSTLLDPAHTSYRPRPEMENDPSYKQLIPYCLFQFEDEIFFYKRGTDQGEARLHSKRSIGIGGHISLEDDAHPNPYEEGMRREIAEEVFLEANVQQECIGLINDDETEVGKVHLGVVHRFHLDSPKVRPREASIMETGFAAPAELADSRDEFESWSQICLDYLLR
ncbi:MAG: phosphoesterase [Planctomycetaceae bacterium]|nr:phosphoesterase [Planctomycetaceae bacterium]